MTKFNIPTFLYNQESPSDLTLIKNLPEAIRNKGNEVINLLIALENSKISSNINNVLENFPFVKSIFLQGNGKIPDALYNKRGDSWVGIGNFNYLPIANENNKEGDRVVIHNKVYELVLSDSLKIWVEVPEITPSLFYDFFEVPETITSYEVANRGKGNNEVKLSLNNVNKFDRTFVPYLVTNKTSQIKTTLPILFKDKFTFSTTFYSIKRTYENTMTDIVSPEHIAVLMYIRDEFENVKIGIGYNKDNKLCFFNKTTISEIDFYISEFNSYQFALQLQGNKLRVIEKDKIIFETNDEIIKNKKLYFAIACDMHYGQYTNASTTFGEVIVTDDVISLKENLLLYEKPRSFSFYNLKETYLDLSLKSKVELKHQLLETLNSNSDDSKKTYLKELHLASMYLTEVELGIADSSHKQEVKEYLETIKLNVESKPLRPSILNEYKY